MKQFTFKIGDLRNFTRKPFDPKDYILSQEIDSAVKVALTLHQPLLLTGEPGTGKTRLADKIALELNRQDDSFHPEPLIFNTKTTSTAQDLFYTYDALKHFHDANIAKTRGQDAPPITNYIELRALGKAIAMTNPTAVEESLRPAEAKKARNVVVLIDEIDKAPRDFTNDILNEIERFEFFIKELQEGDAKAGNTIRKADDRQIVVIMTSNSEKNLPDPFLRRCVFYNIPFPDRTRLLEIVDTQFADLSKDLKDSLVDHFEKIRKIVNRKPPATAELLSWFHILQMEGFFAAGQKLDLANEDHRRLLRHSYSVLVKTQEDLEAVERLLGS